MPCAPGLIGITTLGCILPHRKELVGCLIAVTLFAGTHRGITCAIEYSRDRLLFQAWRTLRRPLRRWREVPYRTTTHNHVPRRHANRSAKRAHVIGSVKHHPTIRELVDVRRVQLRFWIVDLEVERRLVINQDEKEIGTCLPRDRGFK